ncbi:MAG: SDR family oxidoreductase [Rhizobiaceae bacterium]|nr:SDR family oxidoreductase [Rhizobiaceae bacterium]
MDLGIRGRKAIVCASSKGLGKGCAIALAEAGCDLVVNGRNAEQLARTAAEIRERYRVEVTEVPGDVSDPAVQKAMVGALPQVDILVNNNGGPPRRAFQDIDRQAILDGVINNMITPIELIKAVLDGMIARGFGRVVNITSLTVYVPAAGLDVSSGARAGLTSFLAATARSAAASNVTINNILPGKFDTDRLRGARPSGQSETEQTAKLIADVPARRLGTPEEFGQVCAFLCSIHAGYMTGQNIPLDGGSYVSAF